MKILRALYSLLKGTIDGWGRANGTLLAAALSYYATFSLAPLLVIAISIAGLVFGVNTVTDALMEQISSLVSPEVAGVLQKAIENTQLTQVNSLATVVSMVALVVGASILFVQLKRAINMLWGIAPQPGAGLVITLKTHFLSFALVVIMGMLLILAMAVGTALVLIQQQVAILPPELEKYIPQVNFMVIFIFFGVLFAIIFKTLPEAKVAWRDVLLGAAFTSLLFTIGEYLIGFYLGKVHFGGTSAAAGSTVLILIWIYYSMQILLFGAKFTQVYANQFGSHVLPNARAELVVRQSIENQGTE